eukprot:329259-Chlamydomonas_euryale.AAC.11
MGWVCCGGKGVGMCAVGVPFFLQVWRCRRDAASLALQVRHCWCGAASEPLQVRRCRCGVAGVALQVQHCRSGDCTASLLTRHVLAAWQREVGGVAVVPRLALRDCKAVVAGFAALTARSARNGTGAGCTSGQERGPSRGEVNPSPLGRFSMPPPRQKEHVKGMTAPGFLACQACWFVQGTRRLPGGQGKLPGS